MNFKKMGGKASARTIKGRVKCIGVGKKRGTSLLEM